MENPNKQTPATLNQIEVTTPSVPRSFNKLEGDIAGTLNGGHYRTIALKECMANEQIAIEGTQLFIQMQTPRTPAYQRLRAVVKVFAVPHVRVFKNYYQFKAQNGGATENKIDALPNFANYQFPVVWKTDEEGIVYSIQETTMWRDSFASCYIPRVGNGTGDTAETNDKTPFLLSPPYNALAIRGWVAIWNDEIRNKEYETARVEYTGDTVTPEEWQSYFFDGINDRDYYTARAKRNNSYFTNFRSELQGQDLQPDTSLGADTFALNWASFESYFNEIRKQAENAQMNAWDVAQKLGGGKKLTEGRVQVIAEKTFPINYSAITQNAYNNNEEIEDKYRVMGMQGAFSYTEIDLAFLNGIEIVEDCFLHVVVCITADTVFQNAIERQFINNKWNERYRPDLKDDKLDVMYKCEYGVPYSYKTDTNDPYGEILGFKRKYNEMFRLPNCLNGEVFDRGYYQQSATHQNVIYGERILPNNTYQFYEYTGTKFQSTMFDGLQDKKFWLDYTDIAINKNLAISYGAHVNNSGIILQGPNQIVYFGKHYCLTDMPIAEEIKDNFTKWGEH